MELKKEQVEESRSFYGEEKIIHPTMDVENIRLPYLFVQYSKNYMCIIGQDGHLKKVSSTFCEVLGYSEEELFSRPFREFMVIAGQETAGSALGTGNMNYYFEKTLYCKNGQVLKINWRSVPDIAENAVLLVGWKTN